MKNKTLQWQVKKSETYWNILHYPLNGLNANVDETNYQAIKPTLKTNCNQLNVKLWMFSWPDRLLLFNLLQEKRLSCHAASKRFTLQSYKSVCVGFAFKGMESLAMCYQGA